MNRRTAPSRALHPLARPIGGLTATVLALGLGVGTVAIQAAPAMAAVATPSSFSAVTTTPGPNPGEVTISWTHDGRNTTSYDIETGLTSFSTTDASLPVHARGSKFFTAPASARSITLTAAQTASAGAAVGSANHLYFRLHATNKTSSGETATRFYPYLQTAAVAPAVPASTGTAMKTGTFNVRTARATTDARSWYQRVPDVAASIIDEDLDVAAIQELGPGRADGATGTTGGTPRQTESLVTELANQGAGRYKLVRTTPYVKSGVTSDTQGMRILYDTTKYTLVTDCPNTSSDGSYSASCSIKLPLRASGDTEANRRRAAYAEFADKATGEHFFMVSVHLDARHSSDAAVEKTYEALRGTQATSTIDGVAAVNPKNYPVILGGDINTWQNNKAGYTAHDRLVAAGFYDTAAAQQQVKIHYPTINDFKTTLDDPSPGFGARLDVLTVKGVTGASYWENVMLPTDSTRPSDHNMVVSHIRLPQAGSTPTPTDPGPTNPAPTDTSYQPVTPTRVLDTSAGLGAPRGPVAAGGTVELTVTGQAGLPATGVSAVVLNLTSTSATANGYLTAYPSGEARTSASTLNYATGKAMANNVVVKVGAGGKVVLYSSAASQVVVDVQGWFPTGSDYRPLTPTRLLDTRSTAKVSATQKVDLQVTGRGGVPATGVSAVVLNLTGTQAEANGYLTAYPAGVTRTSASSLNFTPGQSTANGVVVKVGTGGMVSLYVSAGTHVIADVQGWLPTGADLTALTPSRLLDTRETAGPVPAGGTTTLAVTGRGGVPASGVKAVVLNVTSTQSAANGYASVFTTGTDRTSATNIAFAPGRSIANRVILEVGTNGTVSLHASQQTHLIADVVGYISE